jgi:hypothetical protein
MFADKTFQRETDLFISLLKGYNSLPVSGFEMK